MDGPKHVHKSSVKLSIFLPCRHGENTENLRNRSLLSVENQDKVGFSLIRILFLWGALSTGEHCKLNSLVSNGNGMMA